MAVLTTLLPALISLAVIQWKLPTVGQWKLTVSLHALLLGLTVGLTTYHLALATPVPAIADCLCLPSGIMSSTCPPNEWARRKQVCYHQAFRNGFAEGKEKADQDAFRKGFAAGADAALGPEGNGIEEGGEYDLGGKYHQAWGSGFAQGVSIAAGEDGPWEDGPFAAGLRLGEEEAARHLQAATEWTASVAEDLRVERERERERADRLQAQLEDALLRIEIDKRAGLRLINVRRRRGEEEAAMHLQAATEETARVAELLRMEQERSGRLQAQLKDTLLTDYFGLNVARCPKWARAGLCEQETYAAHMEMHCKHECVALSDRTLTTDLADADMWLAIDRHVNGHVNDLATDVAQADMSSADLVDSKITADGGFSECGDLSNSDLGDLDLTTEYTGSYNALTYSYGEIDFTEAVPILDDDDDDDDGPGDLGDLESSSMLTAILNAHLA
eukprot:scaffold122694_cov52-Phaeocystis_antarctica.AAC.1